MKRRLFTLAFVVAAVAIFLVPVLPVSADPASFGFDAVVGPACDPGDRPAFNFHYAMGPNEFGIHVWTLINERTGATSGPWVVLIDPTGGTLYETGIVADTPVPAGTLPGDTLTERVEVYVEIPSAPSGAAPQRQDGRLAASDEISWTCGGGPGCSLPIPAGSVVGQFVNNAPTFWAPGKQVEPSTVIPAGMTAWVLGADATQSYHKIIWACQYLWVPIGTMGPHVDAVWSGQPLPFTVVE